MLLPPKRDRTPDPALPLTPLKRFQKFYRRISRRKEAQRYAKTRPGIHYSFLRLLRLFAATLLLNMP
jgi:hypothetical protein